MIAKARLRYLGVSAQKTRLLVDQVRGRRVEDALGILHYSPKLVARDLEKLLRSAVANAQQKDANLDVDRLVVARAVVDEAPAAKRVRNTTMGRVFRVLKRACHVTLEVDAPVRAAVRAPGRGRAAGGGAARPAKTGRATARGAARAAGR